MNPVVIGNATLYLGDALEVLKILPDESVHCCVTSPPYWGLLDYGTAKWEGGDAGCDHKGPPVRVQAGFNERYFGKAFATDKQGDEREPLPGNCPKCGARRIDSQLGLESAPQEYVEKMVAVFAEVRRVLRDDGTLWLNLAASYAASGMGGNPEESEFRKQATNVGSLIPGRRAPLGFKPKDMVPIPWMVAMALQADGWYLRQDIIWSKPNPMPESVRDRCTKAHEYLFLLAKSDRYYFDADAIAENSVSPLGLRTKKTGTGQDVEIGTKGRAGNTGERNKRSVWTVATQPYAEAHFATFPPKLIEPCILAGCPVGGTVLDPFMGSGTAGEVALELSRLFVGIELSETYFTELVCERIENAQRQERLFA